MLNNDIFKGKVNQLKGDLQKRWGKITDDDLRSIKGDYTKLTGIIQEKYGIARAEAEKVAKEFEGVQKKWDKGKADIQKKWSKIKEEEIEKLKGDFDNLNEIVKERYDVTKEEAEKMVNEFKDKRK